MLPEVFYWLFSMSISAALTGIPVLLLGKWRRLPRCLACLLWGIPFFRMWVPLSLPGKYSLMSLFSRLWSQSAVVYVQADSNTYLTATNCAGAASGYFPLTFKTYPLEALFRWASWIWLAVAAAIFLALALSYCRAMAAAKSARPLCGNVYLSPKVTSPAVYGVLRPRILLPESYGEQELRYILAHEAAHIRRGDNLWRILALLTAAVHWFNPFSWIFLKHFLAEVELACDEEALKTLGEGEKKAYAAALLDCAAGGTPFASAFGGAKIRRRLSRILAYRKLSALSALSFAALALGIAYVLLTNAA